MKKLIIAFIVLLFTFSITSSAQVASKTGKSQIGITVSPIVNSKMVESRMIRNFIGLGLWGGKYTFDVKHSYEFGITFLQRMNNISDFETGLEYSRRSVVRTFEKGDYKESESKVKLSVINLPITLRANFLKNFFANGGLMFSLNSILAEDVYRGLGIGYLFGLGAQVNFKNGFSAFINPYWKHYLVKPLSKEDQFEYNYLLDAGIRFGITFKLN